MNIYIFYKNYQTYGGQEKFIYNLSHYLADRGYNITVYAQKVKDKPTNKNIKVKRVFIPPLPRGLRTLTFAVLSFLIAKRVKTVEPDSCVFGFGKTFYQDIYRSGGGVHLYYFQRAVLKNSGSVGRFFYRMKKYLSLSHWINIFIERLTFSCEITRAFIVPSNFVKKQLTGIYNVDERKIKVVRNGVDLTKFYFSEKKREFLRRKLNIDSNTTVFCFVSTNHRLKGLQFLLMSLRILKQKGYKFKLVVAGSGDDGFFLKLIKRWDLEDCVIWLGKRKDIENVYRACDVLVYPTLFDAASSVVLEAMACGLVPVASRYNGTTEIIVEGVNGFVIKDPTDSDEIAGKMEYLLKHKDKLQILKENAIKTVKKLPTTNVFGEIEKIIRENCQI